MIMKFILENKFCGQLKPIFANKYFQAFLFGSLVSFAFAPFYLFFLPLISFPVLFYLLEKEQKNKSIFYLGFSFGFGHFLFLIYWIAIALLVDAKQFSWLIPFALTLIPATLAIYFGLFALLYKKLVAVFAFKDNFQKILTFALCFFVVEFLRSNLLSGFPWMLLGYVWMFNLKFAQIGSIFGIFGLSVFAVLVALFPVIFYKTKPTISDKIFAFKIIISLVFAFIYGHFHIDDKNLITDKNVKIRLVQANVAQDLKWQGEERFRNFIKHIALTNSQNPQDLKAVIWSESSIPYVLNKSMQLMNYIAPAIPEGGVVITGGLRIDENKEERDVYNSVYVLNKEGINSFYDKHHLVPFGEYVPLHQFLSFLFLDKVVDSITGGGKGFSEGKSAQTLILNDFSFSPLICYEAIFSDEVINKNHIPDVFVNVTNDAWFGNSSAPFQHFDMARMRAIEYGIPLIRVANNGITAFVDSFGRVVESLPRNKMAILDVELIKNNNSTIYRDYGNLPFSFLILLIISTLILPRKNAKTNFTN